MTQPLRIKLLLEYLMVMAALLSLFSFLVYFLFSESLSPELNKKLPALAQVASPCLSKIKLQRKQLLLQADAPSLLIIFVEKNCNLPLNPEQTTIEWFDGDGKFLARQGKLKLGFSPTKQGFLALPQQQIQTYTQAVYSNQLQLSQPYIDGYIRISQSTKDLEAIQRQLSWNLGRGILIVVGFIGIGGVWLTQTAIAPIRRSLQQLKQFTDDASHELRSPLTAIQAAIEVMQNHPERIHPKDIKKLAAIARATTQMIQLTEDLLLLARTDGNRSISSSQWQPLPLPPLLENFLDLLEPLAEDKGIVLTYDCQAKVSILGDQVQLNRLFANLLENAIQYTPKGGTVTLRLLQQSPWAVISVEDTGIGIAKEQLPFIFDRFWRADKARSRRAGGTGLGLAIAQAIAKHHGGNIKVSSQVGVGSCFQVSLPLIDSVNNLCNGSHLEK